MDLDQELAQRGLLASGATASCISLLARSVSLCPSVEVLVFAFLGFGFDIVGIGRGEQSLRDLAERLAFAVLRTSAASASSKRFSNRTSRPARLSSTSGSRLPRATASSSLSNVTVRLFLQRAGVGLVAARTRRRRRRSRSGSCA